MINLSDYENLPAYTDLAVVVVNEQEIGTLWKDEFFYLSILNSKIGGHAPANGPIVVTDFDEVKLATRQDFDDFRLSPEDFDEYVADCYRGKTK